MLADVVGATSTAAVSFSDAKAATETLERRRRQQERADGGNPSQRRRLRALRSRAATRWAVDPRTRVDPTLVRAPRAVFTFDTRLAAARAPDPARRRADRRRLHRVGPRRAAGPAAAARRHHRAWCCSARSALAFVLSSKLQRLISSPILRLTEVTRAVSRDRNYDIRAEQTGEDEVGELIDGFNEMLSEIQQRDRQLLRPAGRARARRSRRAPPSCGRPTPSWSTARDKAMEAQPRQERVPRQHEPRDPHADERHHRHDRAGARHAS